MNDSIVWDSLPKNNKKVHYRAGKIISGAIHRTSKELVYSKLEWVSLKDC